MKLWLDYFRFARLALALSFFPFLRGCYNDLVETSGFPLAFTTHINNHYLFDNIDTTALAINVAFFVLAAVLLSILAPAVFRRISDVRVFAIVCICAVFCFYFNMVLFVPIVLLILALGSIEGIANLTAGGGIIASLIKLIASVADGWGIIDFFVRAIFVVVIVVLMPAFSRLLRVLNSLYSLLRGSFKAMKP